MRRHPWIDDEKPGRPRVMGEPTRIKDKVSFVDWNIDFKRVRKRKFRQDLSKRDLFFIEFKPGVVNSKNSNGRINDMLLSSGRRGGFTLLKLVLIPTRVWSQTESYKNGGIESTP